jgi:hypothetical protein
MNRFKNLLKALAIFLLLMSQFSFAQTVKKETPKEVTTIGIIDTLETKSGFRINEYFIELSKSQLDSLKGKKVAVTGSLLIVKGINPKEKEISQGSLGDRLFIIKPRFTIVYDAREPLKSE